MAYTCKDHCHVAYGARPSDGNPANKLGWAKCSICGVKIDWVGRLCPCCGCPLSRRTKVAPMVRMSR